MASWVAFTTTCPNPCRPFTGRFRRYPSSLGLPLDLGEPEAPYIERLDDAIYKMIRSEDTYDFAEASGVDPAAHRSGASSASYAARHGTVTLVSELPYWVDRRANRLEAVGQTYSALLKKRAEDLRTTLSTLGDWHWRRCPTSWSPGHHLSGPQRRSLRCYW